MRWAPAPAFSAVHGIRSPGSNGVDGSIVVCVANSFFTTSLTAYFSVSSKISCSDLSKASLGIRLSPIICDRRGGARRRKEAVSSAAESTVSSSATSEY